LTLYASTRLLLSHSIFLSGSCITLQHPTTVVVTAKQPKQSVHLNNSYTFDRVLAPDVPQETVFEQVRPRLLPFSLLSPSL
jgi:hypothetical protein